MARFTPGGFALDLILRRIDDVQDVERGAGLQLRQVVGPRERLVGQLVRRQVASGGTAANATEESESPKTQPETLVLEPAFCSGRSSGSHNALPNAAK